MSAHRRISYEVYSGLDLPRVPQKSKAKLYIIFILLFALGFALYSSIFLRKLSCEIAMSDAKDAVILAINETVNRIMRENDYGYDYFVSLQTGSDGSITAITTNTAHINAVSTEILAEIVKAADSGKLDIRIPLGNLLGSNLLLGRGPEVPVEIIMLTSSFVDFENDLLSTGINQTKHVMTLKASVDIDILIPWATVSTTVETDILIAETIIVGRVPQTYVKVEDMHG